MSDQQDMGAGLGPTEEPYLKKAGEEITLLELFNIVLKNRRLVIISPVIVFVIVIGYTFIQTRTFTASASFVPQSTSLQSSLNTSIIAQFGISLPTGETGQNPAFYADLITSREILNPLLDSTYVYSLGERILYGSISEMLKISGKSEEEVREKTLEPFRNLISVSTNRETGLISFSVKTDWASVSYAIVEDFLNLINSFNTNTRQTQASAERTFIEGRIREAEGELRRSEDSLQEFLQKNRQQDSPELEFIRDRLQREVNMRQQVYTTLMQAYDQARIDEVRDTPVITIVESPEIPVMPDRRYLKLRGILSLLVGGILGVFGAIGKEFMNRGRQQRSDDILEFERLIRNMLQDFRHPIKFLRG